MDAIKTENLTKFYGKSRGIEGVNLTVPEGDFFGFIGPNGAGKSTTIRTLLGLIRPTSGIGKVYGLDSEREKEKILALTGYLPSEAVFYHGMKVREILKMSADLRRKDCRKEAEILCERLQLDVTRKVDELSFGNRKKVGIVCAMQHRPGLLILDEPTSGLDPLIQKEFFKILQERNQAGTTVFLSSHILSEIQRNCIRAAIIREGKIIACDRVDNLAQTNVKWVHFQGRAELGRLSGVQKVQRTENGTKFMYSGDMNGLLQVLSQGEIQNLSITDPGLEEIFLHYYENGGEEK